MGREIGKIISETAIKMPKPQFLDIPSPFESEGKPIGIIAKSPIDGREKPFAWFKNFTGHSLADGGRRFEVATYVTRMILTMGAEIVVGPAIDIEKCDFRAGKISIIKFKSRGRTSYGYYVESSRRPMFNSRLEVDTEEELRDRYHRTCEKDLFDQTFRKIELSLPRQ